MPRVSLLLGTLAVASTTFAAAADPDPRLAGYRSPPGWKVEIAATEPLVVNPVTMTFGPDGRLYVVEWQAGRGPNDHIKVLTDADGDGVFDQADIYMDGLDLPAGVLFWDGWTYVTLDHDVVRFKDADGDGKFEVREAIVTGFGNDDSHHRVSGLSMGPDGYLYITTGDSDAHAKGTDGTEATVLRSGGVFRCRPDGTLLENVAFGMRNPFGNVAFDDEFHILHTDNDNEGSPGFTGCRLLHVVEGGDYGWRLREGARCCQPDLERATWNGGRPGRLGWMAETGRGAPAGLCVLNSDAFPPSTRNLLVYPDVFRKSVRAYKTKPVGATYTIGEEFTLLAADDNLFRPTDAEIGPDGALYILDWRTDSGGAGQLSGNGVTGRLYRLSWSGTAEEPARPTLAPGRLAELVQAGVSEDGLVAALCAEDYGTRRTAGLELIRRGVEQPARLSRLIADPASPAAGKRHALAVLSVAAPRQAQGAWAVAGHDDDPVLRRLALEYATRFLPIELGEPMFHQAVGSLASLQDDGPQEADPQVLRAKYLLLGRNSGRQVRVAKDEATGKEVRTVFKVTLGLPAAGGQHASYLLKEAAENLEADAFLRDATTRALEGLGQTGLQNAIGVISTGDARASAAALFVLQGWRDREETAALLEEATTSQGLPGPTHAGLFRALRELGEAAPPGPIAAWLRKEATAPAPARAEAIRVLAAMGPRAFPSAAPVLPGFLQHDDAEIRRAALELAAGARSEAAEAALIALAQNSERPAEERRSALADLRGYADKSLRALFTDLFQGGGDPGLRNEALRSLAPLDFPAAATLARTALDEQDQELRQQAIALLGQKADTALIVVQRLAAGKLPPEDLSRVIEAARGHATPALQAAVRDLLKQHNLADAPSVQDARKLMDLAKKDGDSARGRQVFVDAKKANCTSCHRMEGIGSPIGPDLTRVWETLSPEKRLESILEPSREIKEGYATTKVATTDGRVLTGLLLSDTPEALTLRDSQGREVRIPAAEVEQKGTDPVSLMPAGIVGHLTPAEVADLLAFLGDRKAQEGLRKAPPK